MLNSNAGDIIIAISFGLLLLSPIVTYIIYELWYVNSPRYFKKHPLYTYDNNFSKSSNNMMQAVVEGRIKKHILHDNTKKEINDNEELKSYNKFIKTDLFKEIMQIK